MEIHDAPFRISNFSHADAAMSFLYSLRRLLIANNLTTSTLESYCDGAAATCVR